MEKKFFNKKQDKKVFSNIAFLFICSPVQTKQNLFLQFLIIDNNVIFYNYGSDPSPFRVLFSFNTIPVAARLGPQFF